MDEMHFDEKSRRKSFRAKNLLVNYLKKRAILASRLKRSETTIFHSEEPNGLLDRLCLIVQGKQTGNDTERFDNEISAIIDKLLENKLLLLLNTKKIWKLRFLIKYVIIFVKITCHL